MAKEIKQKIVLEGEREYNQAIRDAQRNLKTLRSELKAETAELGKNATEQEKSQKKAESLRKQIAEQEKVVKALREALAEVREKYGDNAEEIARWEQRLNNARTSLANMRNDLEGVSSGFRGVNTDAAAATVATKSVADALGQIGSAGDSVAGAIEGIFTGMIDAVTDAVGELWTLISGTAAKANNWTDIAGYWGTDAQTIQMYARATEASANSFEDLQSAVSKIVMGGKGKQIAELLGISDVNYGNEWDYAMAVMGELDRLTREGRDMTPIYEQIFGEKKGTKVMDLINDWTTIQELLPQFNGNESGYGMDDEKLGTMNDLWVQINKIETKWNALKDNIAAGFGTAALNLLVNVEGAMDGIADYMAADSDEERQAALEKIRANVEEFFTKLGEIIRDTIHIIRDVGLELQESDDPLTSAIGDILVKLAEGLQWMVDHQDEVKNAFEVIFGAWLIAKLAAVAAQLSGILMQIEAIKAFKGISLASGAASGAANAAANATGTGGGTTLGAALGALLGKAWTALKGASGPAAFLATLTQGIWDPNYVGDDSVMTAEEEAALNGEVDNPELREQALEKVRETNPEYYAEEFEGKSAEEKQAEIEEQRRILAERRAQKEAAQDEEKQREESLWDSFLFLADCLDGLYNAEDNPEFDQYYDQLPDEMTEGLDKWHGKLRSGEMTPLDIYQNPEFAEFMRGLLRDYGMPGVNALTGGPLGIGSFGGFSGADFLGDAVEKIDRWLGGGNGGTGYNGLLPEDWMRTTGPWNGSGTTPGDNGVNSPDLSGLQGLPAGVENASERGVRKGISGLQVVIDGQTAGRILAPYVSQEIARSIL